MYRCQIASDHGSIDHISLRQLLHGCGKVSTPCGRQDVNLPGCRMRAVGRPALITTRRLKSDDDRSEPQKAVRESVGPCARTADTPAPAGRIDEKIGEGFGNVDTDKQKFLYHGLAARLVVWAKARSTVRCQREQAWRCLISAVLTSPEIRPPGWIGRHEGGGCATAQEIFLRIMPNLTPPRS